MIKQRIEVVRGVLCLLIAIYLGGCSSIRNYDRELTNISQNINNGDIDYALASLEKNNQNKEKDLLYFMEKGELLRLKGDLQASQGAWMTADQQIEAWENEVRANPTKYVNDTFAFLLNDKIKRYEGYDYEKVMLTNQMALNYLAMGDWPSARVAIRQSHEREALIAEVHDLLYIKQEQAVEEQGIQTKVEDLNGYPIATLNTPSVVNLKNSYQSAFSHYLAGYIYEALGERDLAAPGYRNAIELRPDTPILNNALANLANNINRPDDQSDVLIVMQSGLAPKRESFHLNIPISTKDGVIQVALSLPVISQTDYGSSYNTVFIDGKAYLLTEITNIEAMSRRALLDDLPSILLRTTIRATARALAQQQLNKQVSPWAGLAIGIAGALLEQADLRTWRTLPNSMQIARLTLPKGEHAIGLPNGQQIKVMISNNYQVIQLVQIGNKVYLP